MWSRSPGYASENAWGVVELHLGEVWEQELASFGGRKNKKGYKARRQEEELVNMIKQLLRYMGLLLLHHAK